MKRIIWFGFITVFLLSSVLLIAARYNHRGTGVSIWFPDNWKMKRVGRALYALAPDGMAVAQYIRLAANSIKQARNTYRASMEPQLRHFRVIREGRKFQHNNLTFKVIHAEARVRQTPWKIKIFLIRTPLNMGMLVQRYQKGTAARKVPFTNILESIKPL